MWEQIAKRLHHGLSETIFVNTLTDIREFKKVLIIDEYFDGRHGMLISTCDLTAS